jgi:hypothetical protein
MLDGPFVPVTPKHVSEIVSASFFMWHGEVSNPITLVSPWQTLTEAGKIYFRNTSKKLKLRSCCM